MSQAGIQKAFPKLRFTVSPRRRFRNPDGPEGRLLKMRKTVTALIKYERIELNYNRGDESRGYAERLISDAIRYGDKHTETMEMASHWLLEPQLVHKLFKVLVPRYKDTTESYTRMWKAPKSYPADAREKCVLELRGNVFPSFVPNSYSNQFLLHNILLDEARKEYEMEKELKTKNKVRKDTDNVAKSDVDHQAEELENLELSDKPQSDENRTQ
ncbi:UNVERIFIED_CONTAM: hypothetical protein PYX00_009540 [Menopon gallinae]|uniref:Large ribosomal subunit protein bL17m n=1 Tax=Menopon gallinae TaxID=328185 RepID=A0AAW2HB99_9NEOP